MTKVAHVTTRIDAKTTRTKVFFKGTKPEDDKVQFEYLQKNGVSAGISTEYYENGNRKRVEDRPNGTGTVTTFYENGGIYSVQNYERLKLQGESRYVHQNSERIHISVMFKDNYEHGIKAVFDKSGNVLSCVDIDGDIKMPIEGLKTFQDFAEFKKSIGDWTETVSPASIVNGELYFRV